MQAVPWYVMNTAMNNGMHSFTTKADTTVHEKLDQIKQFCVYRPYYQQQDTQSSV